MLVNVDKSYQLDAVNVPVLKGIDLLVRPSLFTVLLGPSGSGKTTLLNLIGCIDRPETGDVVVAGRRISELTDDQLSDFRSKNIGFVFQTFNLIPVLTAYENIEYPLVLAGIAPQERHRRVTRLLEAVGLSDRARNRPGQLSGGQRQRVAIGRAIVRQPKVFLFDEPLSNLDAQLRGEMRTEIKKLHQRLGATIIYVTHDQVEAMTLADRIAVLSAGHKMQYATPHQIYNTPAALFVAGFTGSPAMNLVPCTLQGNQVNLGDARFEVPASLANKASSASQLTFGIRPENIALSPQPGSVQVLASVVLTEPLGAETLVTFKVGPSELVARCAASFSQRPGTPLPVYLALEHMHLFDAQSGQAIR